MPTAMRDVRSRGQSGKHILAVSFSGFDPTETWTAEIFQRKLTVEPPSGSCKYLR